MSNETRHLPVVQDELDNDEPSCSPKIYISNNEASLLAGMRHLRDRSVELKAEMKTADSEQLASLEAEIEELRAEWRELSAQREKAFIRKMIMLGHLPPTHPAE
jgi:hypothetical protein